MSDLWRLYEAWVTQRVRKELVARLGAPSAAATHFGVNSLSQKVQSWTWRAQGTEIRLFSQLEFTRHGVDLFTSGDLTAMSVTSSLIPDVTIAVRRGARIELLLVDAKFKHAASLTPGEAASEASKYLWGIRADQSQDPGRLVRSVTLATPTVGVVPPWGPGRIAVRRVLPSTQPDSLIPRLRLR